MVSLPARHRSILSGLRQSLAAHQWLRQLWQHLRSGEQRTLSEFAVVWHEHTGQTLRLLFGHKRDQTDGQTMRGGVSQSANFHQGRIIRVLPEEKHRPLSLRLFHVPAARG